MRLLEILLSAFTAFCITGGGAVGVALVASGNKMNREAWILAAAAGLVSAAKDIRSLLRLPPVNGNTEYITKDERKEPIEK